MSEETTVEETAETTTEDTAGVEKQAFLERLNKESAKRKDAEKRLKDLEARLEAKESEGLPELEQLRKKAELAEKRAVEAETAAEERAREIKLSKAERLVLAAAKDFRDPDDATRFVDLSEIEDADAAEKAVKRVAKAKPHLLKGEERKIPGKVLNNGREVERTKPTGIDQVEEANTVAEALKDFLASRGR